MPPVRCQGGAKAGAGPPGGRILKEVGMSDFHYDASRTGLLLVDPYNDFLSEGGKLWPMMKDVADEVSLLDHLLHPGGGESGRHPSLLRSPSPMGAGRLRRLGSSEPKPPLGATIVRACWP